MLLVGRGCGFPWGGEGGSDAMGGFSYESEDGGEGWVQLIGLELVF